MRRLANISMTMQAHSRNVNFALKTPPSKAVTEVQGQTGQVFFLPVQRSITDY